MYTAIPSGQRETEFRATHVDADGFTVENAAHDFPQRITYRRTGVDALAVTVEGPGSNGTRRGFDIAFRRPECRSSRGG